MSRVLMPAALVAAALSFGVVSPAGASGTPATAMTPRIVPMPPLGAVTSIRVSPATGQTEIVISVSGDVEIEDFKLENPHRIVLDVHGAQLGMPANAYDSRQRGPLANLRMSQYRTDVVRVVLQLDAAHEYSVVNGADDVRISIAGSADFAEWSAGADAPARQPATVGAVSVNDQALTAAPVAAPFVQNSAVRDTRTAFRGTAVEAPAAFGTNAKSDERRITVTYENADIRDVIAAFASFSGRTIVTGRDVDGDITAEIRDQPWDVALSAILTAQGLAASAEASGIITVDSYKNIAARQSSEPLVTRLVQVNYAAVGTLVETVRSLLSRDCGPGANPDAGQAAGQTCVVRGQVTADSSTNTLLISEAPSRVAEIINYVRQLDVRTPQVAIKAKLISVNRTQTEQLGVSYDIGSADAFYNTLAPRVGPNGAAPANEFLVGLGGNALAGVANANRKYRNGSALNLIFTTMLGQYSLTTFLDALSEANLSDVQAEPSIVTLDNRTAKVTVGQETPIRVIDAGAVGQAVRSTVQFKETGIILEVTPHITNNRHILLNVSAEQSQINNVGGDLGFVFDQRKARSQILVADGETAVIGGLTQTQITRNQSGIPFLSSLPLIGGLFRQTDSREVKQDLLILLTPRILDDGDVLRPVPPSR